MSCSPRRLIAVRAPKTVTHLLLLATLAIAACSSAPPLPDPTALAQAPATTTALDGPEWQLVQLMGHWTVVADDSRTPSLRFDGPGQRVSGFDGCNRFSGELRVLAQHLKIGPLAATRMACPQSLAPEREFTAALGAAIHWRVANGLLELQNAEGDPIVLFAAAQR